MQEGKGDLSCLWVSLSQSLSGNGSISGVHSGLFLATFSISATFFDPPFRSVHQQRIREPQRVRERIILLPGGLLVSRIVYQPPSRTHVPTDTHPRVLFTASNKSLCCYTRWLQQTGMFILSVFSRRTPPLDFRHSSRNMFTTPP